MKGLESCIPIPTSTAKWQHYCGVFITDEWFCLTQSRAVLAWQSAETDGTGTAFGKLKAKKSQDFGPLRIKKHLRHRSDAVY